MHLILDKGKGEDIMVTHDANFITFRPKYDKFKSVKHLDLTELSKIGRISNVFDLEEYLVLLIDQFSIWIDKNGWQMVEGPGETSDILGIY